MNVVLNVLDKKYVIRNRADIERLEFDIMNSTDNAHPEILAGIDKLLSPNANAFISSQFLIPKNTTDKKEGAKNTVETFAKNQSIGTTNKDINVYINMLYGNRRSELEKNFKEKIDNHSEGKGMYFIDEKDARKLLSDTMREMNPNFNTKTNESYNEAADQAIEVTEWIATAKANIKETNAKSTITTDGGP